jgi:3-hydroxybutyryl-CoA dehydrogenase
MAIDEIKQICVVGAGTMGHQIALQCTTHNYDVHLVDATKEILESVQEKIGKVLEERVSRGEISSDSMEKALSKISYTTDLEKAAVDADFVIEAACMHG